MQSTSQLYKTILAGTHAKEWRVKIDNTIYGKSSIVSVRRNSFLYGENLIGGACSGSMELVLWGVASDDVPEMARIELSVRLVSDFGTSEFLPIGTYWINRRKDDQEDGTLALECVDGMMFGEQDFYPAGSTITDWTDKTMREVAQMCATKMGIPLEDDTQFQNAAPYILTAPPIGYSVRQVLAGIAAAHGGNIIVTAENELRLVPFVPVDSEIDIGQSVASFSTGKQYTAFGNVVFRFDSADGEEAIVRYPTTEASGATMEAPLLTVTDSGYARTIAQNVLAALGNYRYAPYSAAGALLDPAMELGDGITVNGLYSVVAASDEICDELYSASIGAESYEETKSEFIFKPSAERTIERKIAQSSASLRVDIDGIRSEVSGKITTFRQATVPTALTTGDLWYCTANITGTPSYKKDTWYRWSGIAWEESSEDINIPVAPAWASGTSYQKGDVVDEGGVWYAAKRNHTATSSNKPPNSTYWEIRSTISEISKSQISQTMSDITLTVNESSLRLTGGGLDITAPTANLKVNAANITGTLTVGWSNVSGKPSFSSVATSGSYNDLSNKPSIPTDYSITTIIENTVTTGFVDALGVSAVELIGNSIYLRDDNNRRAATLHLTGDRSSWDMRELEIESGNIYINSNADFVVITGGYGGRLTFSSEVIAESDFTCSPAGGHDLGYSSRSNYWRDLFIENDPTVVSDRKKKKEINYDLADMDGFFDDLKPAAFRFINGSSGRRHFGMIAQDVEENLAAHGIDPIDFAGFCKDTAEDDDEKAPEKGDGYALRYGEFISLCIDQIQKLKARVKSLETAS